jgi:tRNA modification GTPase
MNSSSVIVAIATAPGRGGIGVVRVSGRDIAPIARALLGDAVAAKLAPRHATLARFLAADGREIDRGIALLFPAPHSYTGENVLELQGHGGPVVLRLLAARCVEAGRVVAARYAEPGEFTRRAFLNDRLDLAQAEAVADLIDAATETAARSAARSLAGEFSKQIHALVERLIELRTLVEATLDFPDEEIDFLQSSDARGRLQAIRAELDALLARAKQGAVLRAGLHVVLVGAPNVGKSSLLNALAGEEVAIVTPIAGTTRDRIAREIAVDGIPLHIIDTAGVRDSADEVERIGIERTLAEVERADVVLHLVDATAPAADAAVLARVSRHLRRGVPLLTVVNKVDLSGAAAGDHDDAIYVSAKTGAGLEALHAALLRVAGWDSAATGDTAVLARERHLAALAEARERLRAAAAVSNAEHGFGDAQLELFAEELRLAGNALAAITGEFSADDLLGRIFSRFCIGK